MGWPAAMVALALIALPGAGTHTEVTVADLLASGEAWAGERVTVEGELVGDYGFRRDGSMWTQLNGDAYVSAPLRGGGSAVGGNAGIGVRMPRGLAADLGPPGRYGTRGPVVRATGTWRWHDPARQGESYLDVESIELIQEGRILPEKPNWVVGSVGAVLLLITAAVWPRPWRRDQIGSGSDLDPTNR